MYFSYFFIALVVVFTVGFHPKSCTTVWVDRLWHLVVLIPFTGVASIVNVGQRAGRLFHFLLTILIVMLFLGGWMTHLLPNYINRNRQPPGGAFAGLGSDGSCDNPFNSAGWYCLYNNTGAGSLCGTPCLGDACLVGHDPTDLPVAFAHFWLFCFVLVFIVMGIVDIIMFSSLNSLVAEADRELIRAGKQKRPPRSIGRELEMWHPTNVHGLGAMLPVSSLPVSRSPTSSAGNTYRLLVDP